MTRHRLWLSLALLGVILGLSLAGCGSSPPTTGRVVGVISLANNLASSTSLSPSAPALLAAGVAEMRRAPSMALAEDADGVIVKFRAATPSHAMATTARSLGVVRENSVDALDIKVWKLDRSRSLSDVVRQLNARPDVEYAEPNRKVYALTVPNDPGFSFQWHYQTISLPSAWDITKGSSSVVVAVIDSGIRFSHPDFDPGRFVQGWDYVDGDSDPTDSGGGAGNFSHGTHVAGTIGAWTNNNIGVAGVNWQVKLMPLRVLDSDGQGTDVDVAAAIVYAADHGAQVINLSLGGPGVCTQTLSNAIVYAHDRGVTLVAAAGNENALVDAPANHPDVISVGATDYSNHRAGYSNYGPQLDLVAPGGDGNELVDLNHDGYPDWVLSTGWNFTANQPAYYYSAGTSMASPHVAGVAALMIASGITGSETIRAILRSTATDLGSAGRDDYYGYGLLNAAGALGILARAKILLANDLNVQYQVQASTTGVFDLKNVQKGTWYLAAWIDVNSNGVLEAGDYYAEASSALLVNVNQTTVAPTLVLNKVSGSPVVSDRFKPALGL